MIHLPRTASTLRRLLGGPGNAFARHQVKQTAERAARPGASPDDVLEAIRRAHGTRLVAAEFDQLKIALEIDLPAKPGIGGAA